MMHLVRWLLPAGAAGIGILVYSLAAPAAGAAAAAVLPASVAVERRSISSQTKVEGTMTYAGDYTVVNHLAGYFTWLPAEGTVLVPGDAVYRVGTLPVVLLRGGVPSWRDLAAGDSGADVLQLNRALTELGLLGGPPEPDVFGPATEDAVRALQAGAGADPSGALPLGSVVFFPSPLRVVSVQPVLGARADTNSVLLKATSTDRRVVTSVSASQLKRLHIGEEVSVTLGYGGPHEQVSAGRVGALAASARPGSLPGISLFQVDIIPASEAGSIDQLPVLVGFTDASVADALVVPVLALLSTPDLGHAVEVLGPEGSRLVPVQLGVFSEAEGLVQVTGGLEAGDRVVVPTL